jgi:hypothetical protein
MAHGRGATTGKVGVDNAEGGVVNGTVTMALEQVVVGCRPKALSIPVGTLTNSRVPEQPSRWKGLACKRCSGCRSDWNATWTRQEILWVRSQTE